MSVNLTNAQKEVIRKIIYAVETGGQVYGGVRYDDFTEAYTNSSSEHAITIGGGAWYATEAQRLLKLIRTTDSTLFKKLDTAGIGSDLDSKNWSTYKLSKSSAKAKCIQKIISSNVGIKCQDSLIDSQMQKYIDEAATLGVTEVAAQMMCANFRHQGGLSAMKRVVAKTKKPYTLDNLYAACQTDTGNQVGAYKSRQKMVYNALKTKLNEENNIGGNDIMGYTKQDAINAVIKVAKNEEGYLEKATNDCLDSKTANAGKSNFTKYWRDVKPAWNGDAWCAVFVTWVFNQVFGIEVTTKLLKHYPYTYCPTLGSLFTKYANPEVGDIVIFWRNGEFAHTGIVTKVQGDKFWTIEGNTSSGSEIIPNGGAVCEKSYYNSNLHGTKFCRIDWEYAAQHMKSSSVSIPTQPTTPTTSKTYNKTSKWIGVVTASSLNVRKGAGTEFGVCSFSPLKKNTEVNVCDSVSVSGDKWYYIKYNGKYGFVSAKYIDKKKTASTATSWVGEVTASELNVRVKAGKDKSILVAYPKLAKGNRVCVLSSTKASDKSKWYKIAINNSATKNKDVVGYVSATYVKKV